MKRIKTLLYCCGCEKKVYADLTDGGEIYPHRSDLSTRPFWICPHCSNYVGCHHKTDIPTKPLGCIPTKDIRQRRMDIHNILDPIWRYGSLTRSQVYNSLSEQLGYRYHTANIRSLEEANRVYQAVQNLEADLMKTYCHRWISKETT